MENIQFLLCRLQRKIKEAYEEVKNPLEKKVLENLAHWGVTISPEFSKDALFVTSSGYYIVAKRTETYHSVLTFQGGLIPDSIPIDVALKFKTVSHVKLAVMDKVESLRDTAVVKLNWIRIADAYSYDIPSDKDSRLLDLLGEVLSYKNLSYQGTIILNCLKEQVYYRIPVSTLRSTSYNLKRVLASSSVEKVSFKNSVEYEDVYFLDWTPYPVGEKEKVPVA